MGGEKNGVRGDVGGGGGGGEDLCWPSTLFSTSSACWGNTIFTQPKAKGSKFKGVENRLDKQCTWLHKKQKQTYMSYDQPESSLKNT